MIDNPWGNRSGRLIALVILAALIAGCGVKNDPKPPIKPAPEPPSRIQVRVREGAVELRWRAPAVIPEKPEYVEAALWEVLRAPAPAPGEGPAFEILERVEKTSFTDVTPPLDRKLVYALRGISKEGRRGELSHLMPVYTADPPYVRVYLVPKPGDGFVELSWTSSSELGPEVGFNLYRSQTPGVFPWLPVNEQPITADSYVDGPVDNNVNTYYEIRPVLLLEGYPPVEGAAATATAMARDNLPPATPEGLTAIWLEGGVQLKWFSNQESDLAGYVVVRRRAGVGQYEPLTPEPVTDNSYLDSSARRGVEYEYAVYAVDKSQPPNASPATAPIRVYVEP